MPNLLRNILAFLAGAGVGMAVNMALITIGPTVVPTPPGVDVTQASSLAASIHLFQPRHFVMPFLAHALGTFAGALVAALVSTRDRATLAYALGAFFLLGGIAASFMIPAPAWFIGLDLVVAYVPMAWLGLQVARKLKPGQSSNGGQSVSRPTGDG